MVVVEFIAILEGDELNTQDNSSLFCSLKKDALHQPTQSISWHTIVLCSGLVLQKVLGRELFLRSPVSELGVQGSA